ncbi:LysR family transcriptional regulator [Sphingobium sp. AR-3-1]|uniref:LysR family transcriptional regulator n=1 Tax=Sphingobium psychrophilum TaxID=2728834 RepID=A0A7X9ZSQ6_9SPHN|nr:LysR substrate-binding domain-containing protein [Sphingobium psychrophilum]NML09459.1 LysR family transcriptional regulator [Sphingobium psychrophilum]
MPAFSRFLRYFMAVGRLGSIRKAADELNISASAIDRQILNVEADLGMPLFERLPTGLRLTAAGEIMMAAGGRWQKNLSDVRAQIEDLRGLKRGHVDIAIIDALAKGYIPGAIRAIQSRYPGITIGVRVLENDRVREAIASGEADFGILFEPQSYRDLTVRSFVEVVLGFLTPAGHPFGEQREARFSACAGSPLIVPAEPLAVCQQIAVLEGTSGLMIEPAASSDNIQMITSLVMQGVGIGILTSLDVITEVQRGTLSFTRISDPILRPMTLALCTAAARTPSYAAGIVLGEIESGFAQLSYPVSIERADL